MKYYKYTDHKNPSYFYNDKVLIIDYEKKLFRWNYQTDWSKPHKWDIMMDIISERNYKEITEKEAFMRCL